MLTLLRFAKLLAVAALFTGSVGAVVPRDFGDRRRLGLFVAAPALFATWILGFLLAAETDRSLLSGWVLGTIAATTIELNLVLWCVAKDGRRNVGVGMAIVALLVVSVFLMTFRPA